MTQNPSTAIPDMLARDFRATLAAVPTWRYHSARTAEIADNLTRAIGCLLALVQLHKRSPRGRCMACGTRYADCTVLPVVGAYATSPFSAVSEWLRHDALPRKVGHRTFTTGRPRHVEVIRR